MRIGQILILIFCSLLLFPQNSHAQKTTKDAKALETAYTDLAHFHQKKKNYTDALNHYFQALNYSKTIPKNKSGYIYLDIANLFHIMNRRHLAAKYLKKALDYTVKHKTPCLKIQVLNTYSNLAYEEGDYTNALKFINLSLNAEKKIKKYVCKTDSLYRKALILEKTGGKQKEIMTLLKAAVEKGLEEKQYQNLLPVINAYVQKLIDKSELAQAGLYLDKIDDLYAPYHPGFFFYYYLRAILYEKMDRIGDASIYYSKTTNALQRYFAAMKEQRYDAFKEQTSRIYSRIITFYLHMFNRFNDKKYLAKAIYYSEIKNAHTYEFVPLENKRYQHLAKEKKKMENEYLAFHKRYIKFLDNKEEYTQEKINGYKNKLDSLETQNRELTELILEIPISFKAHAFPEFNPRSIREKLDPRQLVIKYALLEDHVYAFYLGRTTVGYFELDVSAPQLVRKIQRLTEPLDDFTRGGVDYLRIHYDLQLAHQLYQILLHDILTQKENKQEIFIVPDGELFKLPFEALVTRFNQEDPDPGVVFSEYAAADYLIQNYAVSYFLSLFHMQTQAAPPSRNRYVISAFGNPVIRKIKNREKQGNEPRDVLNLKAVNNNGPGNIGLFKELPASEKEVREIEAIFGKRERRVFLGGGFNKKNFEIFAPRSRVIHIATHFINNIRYPRYSALLFSPLTLKAPFDYCHAHEVFRMKLNAELVVLSACESSEKHLQGMQGLRGMTASFMNAGARSMIVGMWPVDEHSCQVVPFFYRHYRQGKGIAPALREAKLQLMKNAVRLDKGLEISFAHPFLWANYILYNFTF
ncbi:MAG: CHAT domain-containing protein [bacterium]|nr:CHAT domain-containing protein [bacterium]